MLATNFNQNQNVDFSTPEKLTESNSDSNIILDLKIQNNGYFLLDGLTFKNEKELKENILIKWDKKIFRYSNYYRERRNFAKFNHYIGYS